MTTFCIEREKLDNLNQVLESITLELYKIDNVQALYIVPYIIWQKNSDQALDEEGVNIACYIVLNDLNTKNEELETVIEKLKGLRKRTNVNIIGIKTDVNLYGENNQNSYSRKINDNSIFNGEILFDKIGYISRVQNMTIFESGMREYENKIEFDPPLQIEKIRNLAVK